MLGDTGTWQQEAAGHLPDQGLEHLSEDQDIHHRSAVCVDSVHKVRHHGLVERPLDAGDMGRVFPRPS